MTGDYAVRCGALSPDYFICTEPSGHSGEHVAEGFADAEWASVEVKARWTEGGDYGSRDDA